LRPLKIFVNKRRTEAWDPFLEGEIAIDHAHRKSFRSIMVK
jgi:hypothetical protein